MGEIITKTGSLTKSHGFTPTQDFTPSPEKSLLQKQFLWKDKNKCFSHEMMKAQRNMFHCYWENRPKKIRTLIAKKSIRSRPRRQHHAGGIWKPSFISPVRPSVYTNPEKLSTENRAFQKCSWKRRNKQRRHDNQVICLPESSSNTNPKLREKMAGTTTRLAKRVQLKPCYAHAHGCTQAFLSPVIVAFSNFSGVVRTENILSVF